MLDNFEPSRKAVWQFDGFKDDSAPGEGFRTSYGVTQMTWDAAVDQGIVSGDMEDAKVSDFITIYHVNYWNAMQCDWMPSGVDLMLFNDGTLSGVGHTIKLLQRCVKVNDDGVIGAHTRAAVTATDLMDLIDKLYTADIQYLSALQNAPQFIKGWTRREQYMRGVARHLHASVPILPATPPTPAPGA